MIEDGQGLRTKQESWNADYYRFFDLLLRSLIEYGSIFPALLVDVETLIRTGQTDEAISTLRVAAEELATFFRQEVEAARTHHRYVAAAMDNYRALAKGLRDYTAARGDAEMAQTVETHLQGIEDFTLAGIAHLDPER